MKEEGTRSILMVGSPTLTIGLLRSPAQASDPLPRVRVTDLPLHDDDASWPKMMSPTLGTRTEYYHHYNFIEPKDTVPRSIHPQPLVEKKLENNKYTHYPVDQPPPQARPFTAFLYDKFAVVALS